MSCTRPINALVHGFDSVDCRDAMYMLQSKGLIDIRVWIGDADICSINIFDLFNARVTLDDVKVPVELYDKLYNNIYLLDAIFARRYVLDGMINVSASARLNIFNILAKYLYSLVVKNSIELMLFSNIPHEGPDFLLFEIARYLNIKTIIAVQSLFPNMFFMVRTIEDFGVFSTSQDRNHITMQDTIDSLKVFEKPLFYMEGTSSLSLGKRIGLNKPLITIWNVVRQANPPKQDKVKSLGSATVCHETVKGALSPLERAFNIFFSVLSKCTIMYDFHKYTTHLNKLISHNLNLTVPYIYFPLHFQPELTTVPLGYKYFDQALVLEKLHSLLPAGWKIFVKENPIQTEFMRDIYFFKRIEALDNVVWVPRDYDSNALIRSCKILATVTGTAGWEALLQKKPVIVFGSAWYKQFPHVFTFYKDIDLLALSNVSVDINDIYNYLNVLQNKMGTGVVDPVYNVLVDKYSADNNCRQIFDSIQQFIIHISSNKTK